MIRLDEAGQLQLPEIFRDVAYVGAHYPGAPGVTGVQEGANCQLYAYCILRHFGFRIPDFRSSDLWEDSEHTCAVHGALQIFDLLLWNDRREAYGAHVGLYIGNDHAVHLAKSVGTPAVWPMYKFLQMPAYHDFIGAKRCRFKS